MTDQTSVLQRLTEIGKVAAENDFRPEFFVSSSAWNNVRTQLRPIAIGRKGSGKTALRFALADLATKDPNVLISDLTFKDYPWKAHSEVFDPGAGARSRYLETWSFLILVEFAKLVVGKNQNTQPDEKVADGLRRFIKDNWGSVAFDHRDTFRRETIQISGSFKPQVGPVSAGSLEVRRVSREKLGESLGAFNRWLREGLGTLADGANEYFLVFDELDLEFAGEGSDTEYSASMIGLIQAAAAFYAWAKPAGYRASAVVLMRDDIYDDLRFADRNKITQDLVERIQWDGSDRGSASLKPLIDTRIKVLLDLPEATADPWALVFEDDLMRGTQKKFAHMVQRTYLRPRDLIQFVNLSLEQARRRTADEPSPDDQVKNEDIAAARIPYSKYLREELDDEVGAHHGEWENWLELIRRIGLVTFSRERFDEEAAKYATLTAGKSAREILEALYDFSVLGFARRGGSGRGGTDEYWRYRDQDVTFDPDPAYFRVHWGLKENLALKEGGHEPAPQGIVSDAS
jgi:hypothetical protein